MIKNTKMSKKLSSETVRKSEEARIRDYGGNKYSKFLIIL